MTSTRKGQLEIMGLAVVVILISLIFLFVIQFVISRPPPNTQQAFAQDQTTKTTISALMLTTTTCQGIDMDDLIKDCASSEDIDCNGDGIKDSCSFVESTVSTILNDTIKAWGKNYEFSAISGFPVIELKNNGCPADQNRFSASQPITSLDNSRTIFVQLYVCNQ